MKIRRLMDYNSASSSVIYLFRAPQEPFRALIFRAIWVIEATHFIFEVITVLRGCFEAAMA